MTTHDGWLKKLDQLKKRAQTHAVGVVPIIEVLTWPEPDQERFQLGTDAEQEELITKHYGPLRQYPPGFLGVTRIEICLHAPEQRWRDEDPGDTSAPRELQRPPSR